MAIPGRVGYQCSNFYRHLIKTGEINDPNYMIDDKGDLHYLFGKKDGGAGVIRVHSKHGSGGQKAIEQRRAMAVALTAAAAAASADQMPESPAIISDVESLAAPLSTASFTSISGSGSASGSVTTPSSADTQASIAASAETSHRVTAAPRKSSKPSAPVPIPAEAASEDSVAVSAAKPKSTAAVGANGKRKRRRAAHGSDTDLDSEYEEDSGRGHSGAKRNAAANGSRSSRARMSTASSSTYDEDSDYEQPEGEQHQHIMIVPDNPLPGFIDPITLDPVVKPAISPYGHVMSYDSWIRWIRCLMSEDRKNICPITKNPLSKRELVVLTHDNIELYRAKIVNN
eukprot:jgi/Hompol1/151/HPOL_003934-RA